MMQNDNDTKIAELIWAEFKDGNTNILLFEDELREQFEEILDGCYEMVNICGYDYAAGNALKRLNETAFRQEFLNWLDAQISDGEYYELGADGRTFFVDHDTYSEYEDIVIDEQEQEETV